MNRSPMPGSRRLLLAAAVALASSPTVALETGEAREIEEIRVYANPLRPSSEEVAQPVTILSGEALARRLAPSLGATIDGEPGIHTSYFGPAVGRPIIRGLAGPRVKLLEDGIGALDVSTTSNDHASTVEPFLAEQIEVLRGPATVLYGSGALGGVVNTVTGRIPDRVPDEPLAVRAEVRAGDVADERSGAFRADGGAGQFAWHLDALQRRSNDYDIPGFAESSAQRAAEALEAAELEGGGGGEAGEEEEQRGSLNNSDLETDALSGGLAWIGDRARLGFAISRFETDYGLPGGHVEEEGGEAGGEAEEGEEEGDVRIEMRQTRYDVDFGLLQPLPGFEELRLRAAFNDYRHVEIEPSGETGTLFENEAVEARLELLNAPIGGFAGAVGLQYEYRDFFASGEEAFVSPVEREAIALFTWQQRDYGDFRLELGARAERVDYEPEVASSETFNPFSLSAGGTWAMVPSLSVALQVDLAARAPEVEELFADGPHLATQTFEVGNADLDSEQAVNVNFTVDGRFEHFSASLSLYRSEFDDFIYLADTGLEEDGLPVRQWTQGDARISGAELEVNVPLLEGPTAVDLRLTGDMVRGRLDDTPALGNKDLPRIPARRIGVTLDAARGPVAGELSFTRVLRQDDTSMNEFDTPAYDMLSAYIGWHMDVGRSHLELFLQGDNLLDQDARLHTSFLKETAPLPGRGFQGGVRVSF